MLKTQAVCGAVIVICCSYWAGNASAQVPNPAAKPSPAAAVLGSMSDPENDAVDSAITDTRNSWQPDTTPLTGLETPTIGNPAMRHSYWVPGLQYGGTVQSGPLGASNSSDWFATHYVAGTLSLLKSSTRSTLGLNYSGGGLTTTQSGRDGGWYQQLAAAQTFQFKRWQWQWADQFAYLPETQFGFGAGTGLAIPGIAGALGPTLPGTPQPNQGIFSVTGPRYSNVAVIQGTYQLSARQSITVGGLDGILHFTDAQNVDSSNYIGNFGYDYALTNADSVGLMYRFGAYHFQGQPQAYGDSSISLAYGRKITRRLALQAYLGPDFIDYRVPIGGTSSRLAVIGAVNLTYGHERGGVSIGYNHGLSAGSGVLVGAETDQVTFTGRRQLNRLWSASANVGYAANRALANSNSAGYGSYDNYFAGGGLSRPIGRNLDFGMSYTSYIQQGHPQGCALTNCHTDSLQHAITVFLQWHLRPLVLE
jgi:hypothetical protein